MVLRLDEIRHGTREEFEAALAQPERQASVLIFDRRGGADEQKAAELAAYLAQYRDQILLNDRCGDPDGDDAWLALVNMLLGFTFSATQQNDERTRGDLTEVRQ
jgi:hypothetical protein